MEEGTIIEVKNLFANTPARLNYTSELPLLWRRERLHL